MGRSIQNWAFVAPKMSRDLLVRRNCRAYAFCSSHAPFFTEESSALLKAYRRQIFARTGQMPRLFRPISTLNVNLIESEVTRFTAWCAKVPKPCGMFVHGDDVARKMLDVCRLKGIKVPDELRASARATRRCTASARSPRSPAMRSTTTRRPRRPRGPSVA